MKSPFPGMDPYLENPHTWADFHHELISCIRASLQRSIRPKYVARIEERVYICQEDDPVWELIVPDLRVVEAVPFQPMPSSGGAVTLTTTEPIITVTILDEEVRESRIEIVDVATNAAVTVIEVLSPSNKYRGSGGRDSYMKKRHEIVSSPTHLVEIDLLRNGTRTIPRLHRRPYHYCVHVSEREMRPRGKLWLNVLDRRLPVIEVPLKKEDGHVKIDLQNMVDETYERGGYDGVVNYSKPPVPPLAGEWDAWAKSVIARAAR